MEERNFLGTNDSFNQLKGLGDRLTDFNQLYPLYSHSLIGKENNPQTMSQLIPVDLIVDNLDDVVTEVQTKLGEFIEREDWQKQLAIAFGNNFSFKEAKDIITGLAKGQSNIDIQLLPSKQLKGRGGFDGEKIYLAEELFFQGDLSQAVEVLVEETGHLLEQKLKLEDRPGDEGAVFEAIINQKPLTEVELEALKQEGDRTIIEVNGKLIEIEQASFQLSNDLGEVFSIDKDTPEEMSLLFQWTQREARYNNELGVVVFDNPEGKVNGVAPGEEGYWQNLFNFARREIIFASGDGAGDWQQLDFNPGDYLGFYLVKDNSSQEYLNNLENNSTNPVEIFSSITEANSDDFDHVFSSNMGDGIYRLHWEDLTGGGDRDFNDVVLNIKEAGLMTPGETAQTVPVNIKMLENSSPASHEMGLLLVDDQYGSIDGILPGETGYLQAALASSRHRQIFNRATGELESNIEIPLLSQQNLGWYLIANGTKEQLLAENPGNEIGDNPVAYFSFAAANPDGLNHLYYDGSNKLLWEDSPIEKGLEVSQSDYQDVIFEFNFGSIITHSVGWELENLTVNEADEESVSAEVKVKLNQAHLLPVTVNYATNLGTAKANEDYEVISGSLEFAVGETEKTITIPILGDKLDENDETISVVLSEPTNAFLGTAEAIITIKDNDQAENNPPEDNLNPPEDNPNPPQDNPNLPEDNPNPPEDNPNPPEDNLNEPINNPPVADENKTITVEENSQGVRLNINSPKDIDGDNLTITINELPDQTKGKVTLADGTTINVGDEIVIASLTNLIFTPVTNANGNAGKFVYSVSDGNSGSDSQVINFQITPVETNQDNPNLPINNPNLNANANVNITASLVNDTGISDGDRLTNDPTITGQTTNATILQGNLNGNGFVDISDALNVDGSFTISFDQYEVLGDGTLPDGDYTLILKASNDSGQQSETMVTFTLDITAPLVNFDLAQESDTGILGDKITREYTVNLVGQTEGDLEVVLGQTQEAVTADGDGNFTFTNVAMPSAGEVPYRISTVDKAGNLGGTTEFLRREGVNSPPEIVSEPVTELLIFSDEQAQPIDLSTWSAVQYDFGAQVVADWTDIDGQPIDSNDTVVIQNKNADPSILLSDFDLTNDRIEGTWKVDTNSDDDFMGFVFGYQDTEHYYLFDWKQTTQSSAIDGSFAEEGMNIKVINSDTPLTRPDFWTDTGDGERVKSLFHNTIGWEDFTEYRFVLDFTPGEFTITISEEATSTVLESVTIQDNTYTSGGFGFYNFSQEQVIYEGFTKQTLSEGDYAYDVDAVDADNDQLTYSLQEAPEGMTIDSQTGLINWTPEQEVQQNVYPVTVKVDDGRGGIATQQYEIVVRSNTENTPPEIISDPVNELVILSDDQAQPIDLSTWSVVQFNQGRQPDANWTDIEGGEIDSGDTTVIQNVNADASILLSDFELENDRIEGTWKVDTNFDQDFMGFAFGYQDSQHFYLFDWKETDEPESYGFAERGMSIKVISADSELVLGDLFPTEGNGDRVRSLFHNTIPYEDFKEYRFVLDFRQGEFTITVSEEDTGTVLESVTIEDDTYTSGKFGFYNYSQNAVVYEGFTRQTLSGGNYAYDVDAVDADNDLLNYSLEIFPEGMTIDPQTGLINWTVTEAEQNSYPVKVRVEDGQGGFDTQEFEIEVFDIQVNRPPVINSLPKLFAVEDFEYIYNVEASDFNNDTLTYSLLQAPAGMSIDTDGKVTWQPTLGDVGTYSITIQVDDGNGGTDTQEYELTVTEDDLIAPVVELGFITNIINTDETLDLQVRATDNVIVENLTLTADGNPLALDPNNPDGVINNATFTGEAPGIYTILATATDAVGNVGTATIDIRVLANDDNEAPFVEIDRTQFEETGPMITNLTDLIGTVRDDNLEFYRVEYAPVNLVDLNNPAAYDSDYVLLAEGTTNVESDILASIDPALFANDNYFVRVYAQDINGLINVEGAILSMFSENKPGEFSLDFTDLSIPVAGIPIQVNRTYSSFDSNSEGDFGYGWRLGLQDANIIEASSNGADLNNDNPFGGNAFTVGTRVMLTTPDGRRVGFTFEPTPFSGLTGLFGFARPTFTPDPGVTETLSVGNGGIFDAVTIMQDGSARLGYFLAFNPRLYTLTTKDGSVYRYDQYQGLLDVTDRNGNTLDFSETGIVSSTGVEIEFVRDAEGRIEEIVDPAGNSIFYIYDGNGDLVGVTDRTGNTTEFVYDGIRPHFLTEVIDPLGRTGIRSEYDENGQLVRILDADGNALDLNYDSESSTQTIVDPFGNTTTLVFDDRGNTIGELDALGGETVRVYDDDNNLLSETDPEGNTTSYTYDDRGNELTVTDALGNVTQTTYNENNDILTETDALGNTTTNTYDDNGNLISREDANGNVTTYGYGKYSLLTSITDAEGNERSFTYDNKGYLTNLVDATGADIIFTYDANGNAVTITDPLGNAYSTTYDAEGNITSRTDAEGNSTRTEYNGFGDKIADIDALGRRTEYVYNDRGLLIETIYPDNTPEDLTDNPRIINEYDALDRLIATIDEAGRKTTYIFDALGRQTEIIYPDSTPEDLSDNPRMLMEYDGVGNVIAEIDELGNRTEFAYDAVGNLILERDALGNETEFIYDVAGRQIAIIDANGNRTDFVYDGLGQAIEIGYADGTIITTVYDPFGNIIAETDQAGITTNFEYDAIGRLTAVVDALDQRTEYGLDAVGNIITQTDANGNTTEFAYDSLGRRTAMILPLDQRSETIYDAVGNVISVTDFNGETITYEYNERDRLITTTLPDGEVERFTYTPTGQLATVIDERGLTTYTYDERDRLLSRTEPDGRIISYTYDDAGNILTLTVPSGTTTYTYDALNRIATVTDPDNGITTYSYDPVSNLLTTELPNGVTETREYDVLNRLTYLENSNQNGIISSFDYTLNAVGYRTMVEEEDGRIVEYEYDELYRLTKEIITDPINGDRTIEYRFDAVGNRLERIDSVEGTTTYTYDANNRLLTETLNGVVTEYQYDDDGNLIARIEDGVTQAAYEWNAKGELTAIEVNENGETGRIEYQYDTDGIRVAINVNGEETRFLIDKNQQAFAQVIEEYLTSGETVTSYVHGIDLISQEQEGDRTYYQVDGLGSTRNLTDINGAVVVEYTFDAYGNLINQVGDTDNSYLFTGEQFDSNLDGYYLRARYFDQNTGRFVSRDPFEGFNDQPVSLHDYLYGNVNPVIFTDPSGNSVFVEYIIKPAAFALVESAICAAITQTILNLTIFDLLSGFFTSFQLRPPAPDRYIGQVLTANLDYYLSRVIFSLAGGVVACVLENDKVRANIIDLLKEKGIVDLTILK